MIKRNHCAKTVKSNCDVKNSMHFPSFLFTKSSLGANLRIMAYSLWIWWNVFVYSGARIILIPNWLKTFSQIDTIDLASLFALIYVMVLNITLLMKRDSSNETVDVLLTSIEVGLDLAFIYTAYSSSRHQREWLNRFYISELQVVGFLVDLTARIISSSSRSTTLN